MTRQTFETVETFKNYELQHGTKGDVRILSFGKIFRQFTGQNRHKDAKHYMEMLKGALS